jgi:hypothetical protein
MQHMIFLDRQTWIDFFFLFFFFLEKKNLDYDISLLCHKRVRKKIKKYKLIYKSYFSRFSVPRTKLKL